MSLLVSMFGDVLLVFGWLVFGWLVFVILWDRFCVCVVVFIFVLCLGSCVLDKCEFGVVVGSMNVICVLIVCVSLSVLLIVLMLLGVLLIVMSRWWYIVLFCLVGGWCVMCCVG